MTSKETNVKKHWWQNKRYLILSVSSLCIGIAVSIIGILLWATIEASENPYY